MCIFNITSLEEYERLIASPKLSVVLFFADWAVHCPQVLDVFTDLGEKMDLEMIQFINIAAEEFPEIFRSYQIIAVPTVLFLRNGSALDRIDGIDTAAIITKSKELVEVVKEEKTRFVEIFEVVFHPSIEENQDAFENTIIEENPEYYNNIIEDESSLIKEKEETINEKKIEVEIKVAPKIRPKKKRKNLKEYECPKCKGVFDLYKQFIYHKSICGKIYVCTCGLRFKCFQKYRDHVKNTETCLTCVECNHTYSRLDSIKKHFKKYPEHNRSRFKIQISI